MADDTIADHSSDSFAVTRGRNTLVGNRFQQRAGKEPIILLGGGPN